MECKVKKKKSRLEGLYTAYFLIHTHKGIFQSVNGGYPYNWGYGKLYILCFTCLYFFFSFIIKHNIHIKKDL